MSENINVTKHDWTDDFKYENGNYSNKCGHCGVMFIGHKRRINCRVCDSTQPEAQDNSIGEDKND